MKTKVESSGAPRAIGPYSQTIISGDLIFTAGQIPLTAEGELIEGSIEEQTHQVMKNLESLLKEAGVGFTEVVKTTIYMTDISQFSKVNEVYSSYLEEPFPARETVGVSQLPKGAKLEISMVASKR